MKSYEIRNFISNFHLTSYEFFLINLEKKVKARKKPF